MEVTVIHTETIKPSSPTPSHENRLQLSFLDHIQQPHFVPLIYFYQWNSGISGEGEGIGTRLKKSLADTLTWYYPLAGRIKDKTVVECNDQGVPYFETKVSGNLKEVAEQRNHAIVNHMCPFADRLEDAGDIALAVQVNFFSCGGIAIGVCMNHVVGDGLSIFTFMKFWGAVARADHNKMACPQFGLANVFPPRGSTESRKGVESTKKKITVGKSYLFTKSSISALKVKFGAHTSTEALTTFILTRFISTAVQEREPICFLPIVAANLRTRLNPPLPESHFGNVSQIVGAWVILNEETSMSIQEEAGYGSLSKIRDAIGKVGDEVVKKLQGGDTTLTIVGDDHNATKSKKLRAKVEMHPTALFFTSVSRYPMYDTDFGWGRPIWVTYGTIGVDNTFIFMPTRSGDGIEVQFYTSEADLKRFETDKEFLMFATPAGNPDLPVQSSL